MFVLETNSEMFLAVTLGMATWTAEGVVFLAILFGGLAIRLIRIAMPAFRGIVALTVPHPGMIELKLPSGFAARPTPPESLCTLCVFAHVVRGYERGEEIIACGYAFPPRDILFAVRECTDHKSKRECGGAEIAYEGAVNLPPLEVKAENFRAAAAARQACGT